MAAQLVTLTASGRALCDIVLGANRSDTQLTLRLDEARLQVDLLIFEGISSGVLADLTSVGSHYDVSITMPWGKDIHRRSPTTRSLLLAIPPLAVRRSLQARCQPPPSAFSTRLPVHESCARGCVV